MYCNPPSYYWTTHAFQNQAITPPGGNRCINFVAVAIAVNPPHIVSDIVMLGLPLPMIWGLQVSRSRRVGLAVAFGLAGVGLVGCVVRWVSYLVEMNDTSMRKSSAADWRCKISVIAMRVHIILTRPDRSLYHPDHPHIA